MPTFRAFGVSSGAGDFHSHQVELTLGLSVLRFVGGFDVGASVELSRELNRYFRCENDVTNLTARLQTRWRLGR